MQPPRYRLGVPRFRPWVAALALVIAAACSGAGTGAVPGSESGPVPTPESSNAPAPGGVERPAAPPAASAPTPDAPPARDPGYSDRERRYVEGYKRRGWETNFALRRAPVDEFLYAGLERDAIRPVDNPVFRPASAAPGYMRPFEPVVSLTLNGETRAYPLAILMWHEIINDVIGGTPVAITFCPLCNSAIVFDRRVDGQTLRFGTTGTLRNSNLVMWDDRTQSWWQQITGEALVGDLAGKRLELFPAPIVGWNAFVEKHPDAALLERPAGTGIDYDLPPYAGYDDVRTPPWFYDGPLDERLPGTERVATLDIAGDRVAYPFSALENRPVVNDRIGDTDVLIVFEPDTESAFIPDYSRDPGDPDLTGSNLPAGSINAFDRRAGDRVLHFALADGRIIDRETGSTWDFFGEALEGPLAGTQLRPLPHGTHFWFAWAVFFPDTEVRLP